MLFSGHADRQNGRMTPLVTIGIPVYKRLHFLPNVLASVRQQDYPNLEIIVSDNGMNDGQVSAIVRENYNGDWRLRKNVIVETMSTHFNQIINAASGKYFMLLCDDDEISENYVSEMVELLENNPQASLALSRQEIINEAGAILRRSSDNVPNLISGPNFIRAAWHTYDFKYEGFATFLAKTDQIKACGGFPNFHKGLSHDDALVIKLCIQSYVAMTSRCVFRFRVYDSSHGATISIDDVRRATLDFLQFLETDPHLEQFASIHPLEWKALHEIVQTMNWKFYYQRWSATYPGSLNTMQWIKAAFALPFIPGYYMKIASTLARIPAVSLVSLAKTLLIH